MDLSGGKLAGVGSTLCNSSSGKTKGEKITSLEE